MIDLITNDVVRTTNEILECECIISSSLHGLIVPHAYGIKALWMKFSDKLSGDNTKFYDYFESIGIHYDREFSFDSSVLSPDNILKLVEEHSEITLPEQKKLNLRKHQLLETCPFIK